MKVLSDLMFCQNGGRIWSNLNNNQRRDYIMNSLLNKGYTKVQAAAIVGNLQRENSTFGTTILNEEGSGAIGIAQWLGPRKKQLISDYKNWYDIDAQIDFLDKEIRHNYKGAWAKHTDKYKSFFNTDDIEYATKLFRKGFERPGEHEAKDHLRIKYAYNALGVKPPVSSENTQGVGYNEGKTDVTMEANTSVLPIVDTRKDHEGTHGNINTNFDLANTMQFNQDMVKVQDELAKQEVHSKKVEEENKQLQQLILLKKQEREQMLSTVPKVEFVETKRDNSYIDLLNKQSSQNYYE